MAKYNSRLLDAIRNEQLILFIGSGMSQREGLPNWGQLIEYIIKELSKDYIEYEDLCKVTHLFTEIEILSKVEKHKNQILEILQERISNNLSLSNLDCHKKLMLISSKIITSNYDNILELATGFRPIDYHNDFRVPRLSQEKKYIFKLHGSINDPSKCIFFDSDYKKLYGTSQSHPAVEKLKDLIANNVFLFIGFSLSDRYVMNQFSYIAKIYNNFSKHFVITTNPEDFSEYNIETIKLGSWNELADQLDTLIQSVNELSLVSQEKKELINSTRENTQQEDEVKIEILISDPIDNKLGYSLENITKLFKSYNVNIVCNHLTEDNLNDLAYDTDYVFVFSKVIKNKIVIEDQYFKSNLISLNELEQLTAVENIKGFFIFVDENNINFKDIKEISLPLCIFVYSKDKFKNLVFKLFRKTDMNSTISESLYCSKDLILKKFSSGNANIIIYGNQSLSNIDYKNLINFVGRTTEMESIIRNIINLNNRFLTIKGSGGIGKTTIIKKVALELFERNYFKEGIFFIDCEFIEDYKNLEYKITKCFEIDSAVNFIEHIIQNNMKKNSLIILDNFEFLIDKEVFSQTKELLYYLTDYSTVVVVSRELIELEFEVQYELKNFNTDEAEKLFKRYYKVNENENNKLRFILEEFLNNNPLAIKIITGNLPKGMNMDQLKIELENNYFQTLESDLSYIFIKVGDRNIEKTRSIYQSINYSYTKLNLKQKLVLETLALFPSGIHISNYKKLFEKEKLHLNTINVSDFKILDNKSLGEVNHGIIKLQPIVRRFAEYQFANREDKLFFYNEAYKYNTYLINFIDDVNELNNSKSLSIFDSDFENYYMSLNYLMEVEVDIQEKIRYINKLSYYFSQTEQRSQFIKKLKSISNGLEGENKFIVDILLISESYYEGYFKTSYEKLNEVLPFETMPSILNNSNDLIRFTVTKALAINEMEGKTLEVLKFLISNGAFDFQNYDALLIRIGFYNEMEWVVRNDDNCKGFFKYEFLFNKGLLDFEELLKYTNSLYKKQSMEIMQCYYIMAKANLVEENTIQKLVVVNPYTKGLKKLMQAFRERENLSAIQYYEEAIINLKHIKYYYLEAILYYCRFLKQHDHNLYNDQLQLGLELSTKYKYRFLLHQFMCLNNNEEKVYNQYDYPLLDVDISQYMEGVKKHVKNKMNKKGKSKRQL